MTPPHPCPRFPYACESGFTPLCPSRGNTVTTSRYGWYQGWTHVALIVRALGLSGPQRQPSPPPRANLVPPSPDALSLRGCCAREHGGIVFAATFVHETDETEPSPFSVWPPLHTLAGATKSPGLARGRGRHGWHQHSKEPSHGEHD